ncbi:indole-3-glycerol phosphate synthase-like [Corticium candelabrum]|uniref:indole-3-glycerol phosphate synthase-like n=1 Tax=Corticium candelabrum TaxID=121492 RepID=UPI002E25FFD4|nr:indole-3-glycerol phosphate synthase-like [Corticium candelabrum]
MQCLVEVHDELEMDKAIEAGARIVGINNRDLRTFHTTLDVTDKLAHRAPSGCILVSESGIKTRDDVERIRRAGATAALIGDALVSAPSPGARLRELTCQAQTYLDYYSVQVVRQQLQLRDQKHAELKKLVGIFANQTADFVNSAIYQCGLD